MTRRIGTAYWIFILFLQIFILIEKAKTDGFYLWNLVALVGAIVFIFLRIRRKIIKVNPELTLAGFIFLNGIMAVIAQLIRLSSLLTLVGGLIVAVASIIVMYIIWKYEHIENQTDVIENS